MPSRYRRIVENIIARMKKNNVAIDEEFILDAYNLAAEAHKNDFRRSGAPYIEHPVMVAKILSDLKVDDTTIVAALLHDVVEDTAISSLEIEEQFGKSVADIVEGVTKITAIKFESLEQKQAENYRKLVISMIKDLRVIIIKFADRLHNMRTIKFMKREKQIQKAKETMEVYAPLAYRLGMYKIKGELEDKSFEVLEPESYEMIKNKLNHSVDEMQLYIDKIRTGIVKKLADYDIEAEVKGRVKRYYSIYRKLKTRKNSFEEILDLIAIRIILINNDDCYKVLSVIHNFFKPVPGMFSDFIAAPRPNGYQSLHTKVIFEGKILEVQIRTQDMDEFAENGLAAHWRYKGQHLDKGSEPLNDYIDKLKTILNNSFESHDPKEVLEELKINLVSGEIYVFTPQKELIILPLGSTPIDFAYKIHDNIGNHCIAAKVSGSIIPLTSVLQNGDVVEILTSPNQKPSYDWLKIAKCAKARTAIKHFFKKTQFQQSLRLGNEIFDAEISKYDMNKDELDIAEIVNLFGFSEKDNFFSAIGNGKIKPTQIIRKLIPNEGKKDSVFNKFLSKIRFKGKKKGLKIYDEEKQNINFAKCCHPLPGDRIIGEMKEDVGVVIHMANCPSIGEIEKENIIEIYWDTDSHENYPVKFIIAGEDRKTLLFDIIKVVDWANVNLSYLEVKAENTLMKATIIADVKNLNQYIKIRKKISSIRGVISIERVVE